MGENQLGVAAAAELIESAGRVYLPVEQDRVRAYQTKTAYEGIEAGSYLVIKGGSLVIVPAAEFEVTYRRYRAPVEGKCE